MMDAFKRSLDNYLTSNDREFGDCNPCEDGHEWGEVMEDSSGKYKLCNHCDNELNMVALCGDCLYPINQCEHGREFRK
jgi:hypothetical protein